MLLKRCKHNDASRERIGEVQLSRRCTDRGPTKTVRDARDRKQQIKMEEEFVYILDGEEAIRLEAKEATNPATFIPDKKSRHKPPKTLMYGVEENTDKKVEEVEEDEDKTELGNKKRKKLQPKKAPVKRVPAEKSAQKKRQKANSKKVVVLWIDEDAMVANIALVAEVIGDTRSM